MRLNRENTMIENNLYPLAGYHTKDVIAYMAKACAPYKEYFDQVQAGLYLLNIPMYAFMIVFVIFTCFTFSVIRRTFGSLALGIVIVPYFYLFHCTGFVEKVLKARIFKPIPEIAETERYHIRSLEEIFALIWFPVLWVWRIGFFIYRTYVCPCTVDTIGLIIGIFLLSFIGQMINYVILLSVLIIICMILIPLYVKTTALDQVIKIISDFINSKQKTEKKADDKKDEAPKAEEKKEEAPKEEAPKEEEKPAEAPVEEAKQEEQEKQEASPAE